MTIYKQYQWLIIHPKGDEDSWSAITIKKYNVNSKPHYALLQTLNDDDIFRVIHCTSSIFDKFLSPLMKALHKCRKQRLICLLHNMKAFIFLLGNLLMSCFLSLSLLLICSFLYLSLSPMIKRCERLLEHCLTLEKSKLPP